VADFRCERPALHRKTGASHKSSRLLIDTEQRRKFAAKVLSGKLSFHCALTAGVTAGRSGDMTGESEEL